MLQKDEIKSLFSKEVNGKLIGYFYYKEEGFIFPLFELPENKYDIPTCGGSMYIDEHDKSVKFMTLLDMLDLGPEEGPIYF